MIKKYLYTAIATLLNLVFNFIIFSILPKSISESGFGIYQFANTFFTSFRSLINISSNNAVFQISSKIKKSQFILKLYFLFLFVQLVIGFVFLFLLNILEYTEFIFSTSNIYLLTLIAIVEFSNFIYIFLLSYGDAKNLTVKFQKIKIYEMLIRISILVSFYFYEILTLYNTLLTLLISFLFVNIYLLKKLSLTKNLKIENEKIKFVISKVIKYSLPLLYVEILSSIYKILDQFLIQHVVGMENFAYYIYSFKFIFLVTLLIQPMFNVLWQFISINYKRNQNYILDIYNELLFFIYIFSFQLFLFFLIFADDIINILVDERYKKSIIYLKLFSVLVIPLAVEKLSVVILYATDKTNEYKNIIVLQLVLSLCGSGIVIYIYNLGYIDKKEFIYLLIFKIIVISFIENSALFIVSTRTLNVKLKSLFNEIFKITILLIGINTLIMWFSYLSISRITFFIVFIFVNFIYLFIYSKKIVTKFRDLGV